MNFAAIIQVHNLIPPYIYKTPFEKFYGLSRD